MMLVTSTPTFAGASIHGSNDSFLELYESLHWLSDHIVDSQDSATTIPSTNQAMLMALAYNIRHALVDTMDDDGDIEAGQDQEPFKGSQVEHRGMSDSRPASRDSPRILAFPGGQEQSTGNGAQASAKEEDPPDDLEAVDDLPDPLGALSTEEREILKDLPCQFAFPWPDAVHLLLVLHSCLDLGFRWKRNKRLLLGTYREWAVVKTFQNTLLGAYLATLKESRALSIRKSFVTDFDLGPAACPQYVDLLSSRHLAKSPQQRVRYLVQLFKKLTVLDAEGDAIQAQVLIEAARRGCHPSDLALEVDFPEDFQW